MLKKNHSFSRLAHAVGAIIVLRTFFTRVLQFENWLCAARLVLVKVPVPTRPSRIRSTTCLALLTTLFAVTMRAQVAVDATTSGSGTLTGAAATLTVTHTTTATANRLMLVGVSMNITNGTTAAVSSVTWNGTALTLVGAHNDTANTRRVELWSLTAPATGFHNVIVTVNTGGGSIGVVAGATTFTGVDQNVPLGTFVSSDAANGGASQLDVPSVINGMILDTLATDGTQTITVPGPQVSQWTVRSSNTTNPGVRGAGASRTGAPSVPISETLSGTSNWSYGAVSINPSTADIGVTTSVSAVALGQNSTYNIRVTNNGFSAANNVILTDALAAGVTLVSATPSAGTTCAGTGPITCTLPTSFASGAVATVAVVVSTTTAGFYQNTATITDSGTPPDPNTGNNTYVALAPVVSVVCSGATLTAGGTLGGVLNTYYPGSATVAKGATSIPVGTPTGAGGAIASGSLLLVIQMQDATINTSNTVAYGNGSTGTGFTAINNAGNYEFVTATGPVSGGNVPIKGAGAGTGLVFGYTAAAASNTKGVSTYQVVLVPQFTSATLGAVAATSWNGSTGGILALDVAGQLDLGGANVSVDGQGFRGGAGMQLSGAAGASTDYRLAAPATYTGTLTGGADGPKGEGVAGTPEWVKSGLTFLHTLTGYPSGSATDGSMAHGSPATAGGGGTDSNPTANDQNAGGGGGANGGAGGFGGDSWSTNLSSGGEGGSAFPATIDRISLGGGGGAGSRNNSDGDDQASSGSPGGGMIFIRAYNLIGTATLSANGAGAYNGTSNDAGGGGGAGGSIVVLTAAGGESGLTLQANGGRGGDAWDSQPYSLADRHGPGGGGGGGVIFVSGATAGISVGGGANGTTLNPGVAYGATSGTNGSSSTAANLSQVTGMQSAALCAADLTLSKSHVGYFTRGSTATYTIPVSNVATLGSTSGTVTINDTLPTGLTPTSATGTGWACSITGQTVSCVRSDSIAPSSSYPSITITALVLPTAPSTVTNTAVVSGGGEGDTLNDVATDTANVGSSADLAVTDAASPNPVASGANITYTQVVTNNGPSAADSATLVATIPANTTMVSLVTPAGWNCTSPGLGGTGNVVCTNVSMAASTSSTFTLVVKVNSGTANGTVITENVTVGSSITDPIASNNTATATTVVGTNSPNLTVTNVAAPNPVLAGSNITYTQVVTNTGSTAITSGTFTESTPANTTFVSITPPAGWTCTAFPAIPCTATTVAAGASGTFTVVYKVNAGTANGTIISDTVTVTASNQSFGANSATATDVVGSAAQADLALSTAASPSTVLAGNNITYTQTITNNGPATASGVVFTEVTPPNTTYQSVSAPAGWTCTTPAVGGTGTITCNNPTFASAATANISVLVNVPANVVASSITAISSVAATTSDPISSNNTTTVNTPVNVACDLTVTNSGTPSPVTAGSNITYTQTVYNNGPSYCTTATLSEATPANTTFVSVSALTTGGGTWTCPNSAPVSCTNPSVPPGSTGTITAIYKVNAGTTAGTLITDTVTGSTTTRDTNSADNSATVTIAVATAGQADLSVTNFGSPNPVAAGANITYTQSVTNAGPATANAPIFTDTLPANTTAVSLTGPAGWTCVLASLTCSDTTTMAANVTANFTLVVKVNTAVATGTIITQTDSVSSTTGDPTSANNSATVNISVSDSADLSVTNIASPVPVQAGNNITYAQVVNNAGPSTATSVALAETLPANTTFVSLSGPAGWTCTAVSPYSCSVPSLAPSTPATFTFVVKVTAGTSSGTAINDTATVSSSIADPNSANNTAVASDIVATATQADLVSTNSASPTSLQAGNNVTYTQAVTNNGLAATAIGMTFTQTVPPNMNFVSMTPPGGWTCVTPAVGGTGSIVCTDSAALAMNGTASFTLVMQVNSGTPTGTNMIDTVTASATNMVPGITTNVASAQVTVASASTADVAITKSASPNPALQGTTITYILIVTNNGPSSATNVNVSDPLPSAVTYLSSSTSQGSCSIGGGTFSCQLGTIANGSTATITILTNAVQPGTAVNTASVSAVESDPDTSNNTATQTETITNATIVALHSFWAHLGRDKNGGSTVVLTWKTGTEAHNLGFNVYREQTGNRVRMNPSMIAGSALLSSSVQPMHSGRTYAWIDSSSGITGASYWVEDIDLNGTRTMHGPVTASSTIQATANLPVAQSRMMSQMNQAQPPTPGSQQSHIVERVLPRSAPTSTQIQKQFDLASHPAVKILVRHEGWYRVTQPELIQSGLDPNVDPSLLHLYAEGIEQPLQISGAGAGPGGLGPQSVINFYGTGIDTEFSGTRVYWLAQGDTRGARIQSIAPSRGSNQPPASYAATVETQQHTIYFAALLNTTGQNFFGALVSPTPVDQVLQLPHLDTASSEPARLEVALQGIIIGYPHDVTVAVNGTTVGDVIFTGQDKGQFSVDIPAGVLQPWSNTVTLTAQNGDYDTSLVDAIRITYPHRYVADSDQLKFTGRPGEGITITGFASLPAVLDITDPNRPVQLVPESTIHDGKYEIGIQVPFTSTRRVGEHTLLAVATSRVMPAVGVWPNHPSRWHGAQAGADIALVTHGEFASALVPLVQSHQKEGKSSVIIPIGDLYDEFTFGEHSPYAIRQFLQTAKKSWSKPPSYLLLNGRASLDPRNYLGFGNLDLVPTRIIPTASLMTASDDWFSDFNDSGVPTIATGRLPVSTIDEATTVVGKIAAYEDQSSNGPWTSNALMVADKDDTSDNFTGDTQTVQAFLPPATQITEIFVDTVGTTAAEQDILDAINSGQGLVNYLGHGSEEQWSGSNIFNTDTVDSLTNGSQLPVFMIMNCLNGFFQDVYSQPLGVTLLLSPTGGASAVFASTGLNQAPPQAMLDGLVLQSVMQPNRPTLGDSIVNAKAQITDPDVRKTFVLFGDPAMRVKQPAATSSAH